MFIVTVKENSAISPSEILCMGSRLGYLENGYPHLIDENLSFVNDSVDVFDVESVPEGIEPTKYCYTPEKGFYENPNYTEPDESDTEQKVVNSILDEVSSYGY